MKTYILYDRGELIRVFDSFEDAEFHREIRLNSRKRAGHRSDVRVEQRTGIHPGWLKPFKEVSDEHDG